VDGAYNFVDVRDVAQGLMAAAVRGRRRESYVLAGHEMTVAGLLAIIEEISGAQAPRIRLPFGFARAASFIAPAYYRVARRPSLFTTYSLDVINSNCLMSHGKARCELDYSPRPLRETLEDTVRWFREERMI
jgi:dihydroflavonol-4-reductase